MLRPNHRLGNAVLLTPLIDDLGSRFPDAEIEFISTGTASRAVFKRFPQVTDIHLFPQRSYRNPLQVMKTLITIKGRHFDLAVDPMLRSRASRFMLGQVAADARVGFAWDVASRDRILTHAVPHAGAPHHLAHLPLHLLRTALGPSPAAFGLGTFPSPRLNLRLSSTELTAGRERLAGVFGSAGVQPVIGIFAAATGTKCLSVEWWAAMITSLRGHSPNLRLVEFIPADGIARLSQHIPGLHTPDLRLLGATLAATSLVAIADCGVMHLADAAGARVLGLFKTTDPIRYGPCGASSESLILDGDDSLPAVHRVCELLITRRDSVPATGC